MSSGLSSWLAETARSYIIQQLQLSQIRIESPCSIPVLSLIALIASLFGFLKFPVPPPRHAVLLKYTDRLSAVSVMGAKVRAAEVLLAAAVGGVGKRLG